MATCQAAPFIGTHETNTIGYYTARRHKDGDIRRTLVMLGTQTPTQEVKSAQRVRPLSTRDPLVLATLSAGIVP